MTHSTVHAARGKTPTPEIATHTTQGHIAIVRNVLTRLRANAKRDAVPEINAALESLAAVAKAAEGRV